MHPVCTLERSPVHAVAVMLVFTLRKIESRLLFPTSAVVICLVAGVALLVVGRRRDRRRLAVSGLVLLCVAPPGRGHLPLEPRRPVYSAARAARGTGFRAAGFEVTAAPAAYYAAARSYTPWSLIPSAASLEKFERAAYEYLGLLAMHIGGR